MSENTQSIATGFMSILSGVQTKFVTTFKKVDENLAQFKSLLKMKDDAGGLIPSKETFALMFLSLGKYETQSGKNFKHGGADFSYLGVNAWWQQKRLDDSFIMMICAEYVLPAMVDFSSYQLMHHVTDSYMVVLDTKGIKGAKLAARRFSADIERFSICYAAWIITYAGAIKAHNMPLPAAGKMNDNFLNWWKTGHVNEDAGRVMITQDEAVNILKGIATSPLIPETQKQNEKGASNGGK